MPHPVQIIKKKICSVVLELLHAYRCTDGTTLPGRQLRTCLTVDVENWLLDNGLIKTRSLSEAWSGYRSRYSYWLRHGRSVDRIPVGTRFSAPVQTGPGGPPSLLYNAYRVFPGGKERPGRDADPSPLLMPWSRNSSAIPLLPLWAVRAVQSLCACTGVHFTFFTFYLAKPCRRTADS